MKKGIIVLCLAFAILFGTKAEETQEINKSQAQGDYSIDFNFDPAAIFDARAESMFTMPNVRFRMFQPDGSAYRINVGLNFSSEKNYSDLEGDIYTTYSETNFSLAPGIEKPLTNTSIRIYYGAELPISIMSEKVKSVYHDFDGKSKGGSFGIGLNAIFGVDYNIKHGFYLGFEFTPGFNYTNISDTKAGGDTIEKGGTEFIFRTNAISGLRAGIRF